MLLTGTLRVAVITVSDRSSRGEREDVSGPRLAGLVAGAGHSVVHRAVVSDDEGPLAALIAGLADGEVITPAPDLVLLTGGTGLTPRDRTPEAVESVCPRLVPGIGEAIRSDSRPVTEAALISRALAGVRGDTLVIALPGSPGGAADGWATVAPVVAHACAHIVGQGH